MPKDKDDGKKIVESQCGTCHSVETATQVNQDRDKWNAMEITLPNGHMLPLAVPY